MPSQAELKDKFIGTFIGLALGDALGAPYEGGFIERFLWKFFSKTPTGKMRWTDDIFRDHKLRILFPNPKFTFSK